jgi:hypothetical protein
MKVDSAATVRLKEATQAARKVLTMEPRVAVRLLDGTVSQADLKFAEETLRDEAAVLQFLKSNETHFEGTLGFPAWRREPFALDKEPDGNVRVTWDYPNGAMTRNIESGYAQELTRNRVDSARSLLEAIAARLGEQDPARTALEGAKDDILEKVNGLLERWA